MEIIVIKNKNNEEMTWWFTPCLFNVDWDELANVVLLGNAQSVFQRT